MSKLHKRTVLKMVALSAVSVATLAACGKKEEAAPAPAAAPAAPAPANAEQADIEQALLALGYSEREAAAALKALPPAVGVSEGIKLALKALAR